MKKILLLIAAALLLAPGAWAENCTFTTDGDWSAVGTYGGTVTGSPCTLSADDDITISAAATITGDIVQTAGGSITVASGGSLIFQRSNTVDTPELTIGTAGLTVESGGTLTAMGSCKLFRDHSGATYNTDECGENEAFFVGDISPCDDGTNTPSCSTDAQYMTFVYPESKYGNDASTNGWGNTKLDEAINDIEDGHDQLCFLRYWSNADAYAGELLQCYVISSHTYTTPTTGDQDMEITIDLYQGSVDTAQDPVDRRDVFETTLAADVLPGQRSIELAAATFGPDSCATTRCNPLSVLESDYDGIWIRFDGSEAGTACTLGTDCEPSGYVYRTQDWEDDFGGGAPGPDSVEILDVRGVTIPTDDADGKFASGETVWIGNNFGFRTGDRFFVMDPVVIKDSGTPAQGNHALSMESGSTVSLRYVRLEGGAQTELHTCPDEFRSVWIMDPQADGDNPTSVVEVKIGSATCSPAPDGYVLDHVIKTGIAADALANDHVFMVEADTASGVAQTLKFRDLGCRNMSDDCFWSKEQDAVTRIHNFTIDFVRSEWVADNNTSLQGLLQCVSGATYTHTITVNGGLVVGITGLDNSGTSYESIVAGDCTTFRGNELFVIGGESPMYNNTDLSSTGDFLFTDSTFVDIDTGESGLSPGNSPRLIGPIKRSVVRESSIQGAGKSLGTQQSLGQYTDSWIVDVAHDVAATPAFSQCTGTTDGVSITNTVFEDVRNTSGTNLTDESVVTKLGSCPDDILERVSFIQTARYADLGVGSFYFKSGPGSGGLLDFGGFYCEGLAAASTFGCIQAGPGRMDTDDVTYTGPVCRGPQAGLLFNTSAARTDVASGTTIYEGYEFGVVNRDLLQYGMVRKGMGDIEACGVKAGKDAPGVHKLTVAHGILGVLPENVATLGKGLGGGGGGGGLPRAW